MANMKGTTNFGMTNRSFGLPGRWQQTPVDEETVEERISRETVMAAYCRYCEQSFIRKKLTTRFHDPRCDAEWKLGKIHEATFKRWQKKIDEMWRWHDGSDDPDYDLAIYTRPFDVRYYDWIRRQLYYVITDIQKRVLRSRAEDALKAMTLLTNELLKLHTMNVRINFSEFWDPTERKGMPEAIEEVVQDPLPKRGMEGWKMIYDRVNENMSGLFSGKPMNDMHWLDY